MQTTTQREGLGRSRRFVAPRPGDDFEAIARRELPELELAEALERLQSWNLHLFARQPSGRVLGADVVFVEPPLAS
ncbi:MAG: hypothetical protein V2J02_06730 [Pseudomonadales bacterium]|jgi:hypothetical protein|nr:hypothetical protein [Pseudomonadales bacterium]